MAKKPSINIGEVGVDSVRIGGMTPDDLPIGEGYQAKLQLPGARELERQTKIANVRARYPMHDVAYLESRITEARGMIATFRQRRDSVRSDRETYSVLLTAAKKRDDKIAALPEGSSDQISDLNDEYGPWEAEGLAKQIEQFDESIARFDETIKREQESIDELSEVLGECRARDKELSRL